MNPIEPRRQGVLGVNLAVVGNGEAVHLVLNPLHQVKALATRVQIDVVGIVAVQEVGSLVLIVFDHPDHRNV